MFPFMFRRKPRLTPSLALAILLPLVLVCSGYQAALRSYAPETPASEVRALWVVRDAITSRESIDRIIAVMRRQNLNTAVLQVRGRGDAFYRSTFVPRADGIAAGLDPLDYFLKRARPQGIEVHAWVNVFLAADKDTHKWAPRSHLMYARRDWFLRDARGRSLLDYSPRQWRKAGVEGAFLDPARPDVRAYNLRVITELLDRYPVDGLHLDYIRYPWSDSSKDYDFGRRTARAAAGSSAPLADDDAINRFRRRHVTAMVAEVRSLLDRRYPGLILSAAVWPNYVKIRDHIYQDFPHWLKTGLVDYAFLMAYYGSIELHDNRMKQFYDPAINDRLVIGIGVFKNPEPEVTLHQLKSARAIGAAGVCYFRDDWFTGEGAAERIARHELPRVFAEPRAPNFIGAGKAAANAAHPIRIENARTPGG